MPLFGGRDRDSPDDSEVDEHAQQKEEATEKREDFMRKHFRRTWPKCMVAIVGILQLLISLTILAVDLPVILMFAPRWQVLTGVWTFIFGFMASVATLHSTRKMTWIKIQGAMIFNVLGAIAGALMVVFNILFAANPYICLIPSGCTYLPYTYSIAKPFYFGEIILGLALVVTTGIFIAIFAKYGIGGRARFDNIQRGYAPSNFNASGSFGGFMPRPQNPRFGPGNTMNRPPPRGGFMPGYPSQGLRGGMMGRPQNPMMMPGGRGPMMPPGPRGPMMPPGPRGPMMPPGPRGSMMQPGPRGPMQPPYGQTGPR